MLQGDLEAAPLHRTELGQLVELRVHHRGGFGRRRLEERVVAQPPPRIDRLGGAEEAGRPARDVMDVDDDRGRRGASAPAPAWRSEPPGRSSARRSPTRPRRTDLPAAAIPRTPRPRPARPGIWQGSAGRSDAGCRPELDRHHLGAAPGQRDRQLARAAADLQHPGCRGAAARWSPRDRPPRPDSPTGTVRSPRLRHRRTPCDDPALRHPCLEVMDLPSAHEPAGRTHRR